MTDSTKNYKSSKHQTISSPEPTRPTLISARQEEPRSAQEKQSQPQTAAMDSSANLVADNIGKTLRSRAARRSLSGVPLTCLFESKFKHFKAFQMAQRDSSGLNFLLAPPSGAIYRSSMPVTPIATPISSHNLRFTEQSLQNRILMASQSSSPRRSGQMITRSLQTTSDIKEEEPQPNVETRDKKKSSNELGNRKHLKPQPGRVKNTTEDKS